MAEEEVPQESAAARGKRLAAEAREAEMRKSIEAEMREKFEAEYAAKAEAEAAALKAQASLTATTVAGQALPENVESDPAVDGSITIHMVDDGLSLLGKQWYRGEEITIAPGTPNWEASFDKKLGKVIPALSESEQYARWGKRLFAPGPWPHGGFDLEDENLTEKERELLRSIQQRRDARAGV